jgi:hypothetical protein
MMKVAVKMMVMVVDEMMRMTIPEINRLRTRNQPTILYKLMRGRGGMCDGAVVSGFVPVPSSVLDYQLYSEADSC